jgi:REP element-mobilizing transposase RayT
MLSSPHSNWSDRLTRRFRLRPIVSKTTLHKTVLFVDFKYHFAWNVIYRKPVFALPANIFDFVSDTFSKCSEMVGGFVDLLWLAPDHLHLYVESDGSNSVETIAQEMKRVSAAAILAEFSDLKASLDAQKDLWDKAYFVESIG